MLKPEHISEAVWRAAMSTYHKELRKDPGMAWQKAMAAAINSWAGVVERRSWDGSVSRLILPLEEK